MLQEAAFTNIKAKRQTLSGAELLLRALEMEKVEVIFGYPGGAVLPLYDKLYDSKILHVLPRHEQGGIHAAEGYARITGRPGVVIATSGPGATNIVTGLTDAMMDSLPLIVFTGQVPSGVIGTDAFQEADILGITTPITKYNYQVRNIKDIPRIVKEAFYIATSGRPGPVLIDIPKDIATLEGDIPEEQDIDLPGYQPTTEPNYIQIRKLTEAVSSSKRPVILAGAGVLHSKAARQLKDYVEQQKIPVIHTLLGLGGFPADHPLYMGMAGMHGCYGANMGLYECDLLINIGARFDDRLTGNLECFAPHAKVAHIDIDPAEIGKNVNTHIPIVADAKAALLQLIKQDGKQPQHNEWLDKIQQWKGDYPFSYESSASSLKPQRVMEMLYEKTKGEAIVVTDVGQHQMWAAQYYPFKYADRWVTSGGLGTMGFGLPASIGAQLADRSACVLAVLGDGGFQMSTQELAVIKELNLPIKIIIFNNLALGMVRQWQEIFYESRFSHSKMTVQPSFVKLAEAYGIKAYQIQNEEEGERILQETLSSQEPVLLDFRVDPDENVYPMVAPGKGVHEMVGVIKCSESSH
ncbi:acetolactate synthase large subunit [Cytobacillus spongiae]|jgi:acetolactate synthase-1/2/3 large subunit|uniref:acetolactate synthase large subunit n=1 Tax=Cytobacillus spongiae TaxID=2901381 RepID=UPI001F17241B|nr:acetolactate synthase large subunit [Cytobacillus spongiae]UII55085.1 acetolactate synthase large subunit [Cytobacillus spongiae]